MQEKPETCQIFHAILEKDEKGGNRVIYTRENKYIIREYKFPGEDKPRLGKAVNVDFVPFIRGVRVLCKPQPE